MSKQKKIVIAGAGTFGLSTAWHLARAGYNDITVLDRHPAPSIASAGHDLNKIFRTEYADPVYAALAHEARDAWLQEEALKGCYHETGYIFSVSGKSKRSVQNYEEAVANSRKNGVSFESLDNSDDFRKKAKVMTGPLSGWKGVYNAKAGWTHARKALQAIKDECDKLGVRFISGEAGEVISVAVDGEGRAIGLRTADDQITQADLIILALGAWLDSVIDTKGQSLAKAWCFAHIQLTEEEADAWKDAPVINNRELGYIFEPDADQRRLKIAPHGVGYTHYMSPGKSFPRCKMANPSDSIPDEAKSLLRELLRESMPELADRPFAYERMCWDADTPDAHFIITRHPDHPGLVIAGGGAAHAFKFTPILGKYVRACMEDQLPAELAHNWRWRPHQTIVKDYARPDKPDVDLADLQGWRQQAERESRL